PKGAIGGAPVGIVAYALFADELRPFVRTKVPAAVMRHIRTRSRRDTCPCESAFTISARFLRAFSASRTRAFAAFRGRYTGVPLFLREGRASPAPEVDPSGVLRPSALNVPGSADRSRGRHRPAARICTISPGGTNVQG